MARKWVNMHQPPLAEHHQFSLLSHCQRTAAATE